MKVRDIPKSGRDDSVVHSHRGATQYVRAYVKPADRKTDARLRVRELMTVLGNAYHEWLTEAERQAWDAAAQKISSRPRLGLSGPLTGQVHFVKLNLPRGLIGRPWLRLPSDPVRFGSSPVGELTIRRVQDRLRLELAVSGPVTGDIMVFATPPCPATWRKCRKPRYLGLLPTPVNGVCDITELYLNRFGEPEPGQRIFVRTLQQREGWESDPADTSSLVPAQAPEAKRRTRNPVGAGAWSLGVGAFMELGVWSLELPSSSCPWEIHAVNTVSARCARAQRRTVWGAIPPPGRRWRTCERGEPARASPRERL